MTAATEYEKVILPEFELSQLIARELKIHLHPGSLRHFLLDHFDAISKLAHQVHDEEVAK